MRQISILFLLLFAGFANAQEELMALLEDEMKDGSPEYAIATFKSTRVISGHSIEMRTQGVLEFIIGHRFGTINSGYQEFWGLDNANIRLGLEYGITNNLNIGIGRSSFDKVLDGFVKYRFVRQSNRMPFTVTGFASIARKTVEDLTLESVERNAYTGQILIARKFNSNFSLQVMPTMIQRNLVATNEDANLLIAMGVGGRYKVSNRVALVAEYYPQLSDKSQNFRNAVAIGFDIETGGHVFQLHLTNAVQMNERGFIGETTDDFWDGGIHFGFNISRVFNVAVKD